MDVKRLCELIDEEQGELFELLSSFIKFNTENFTTYANEKELAEHLHSLCLDLGLESDLYSPIDLPDFENHPDYVKVRSFDRAYNVTAKMKGDVDENGLMLMGHIDTVPIGDLANWERDPLSGEISDGRIYGRGAGDDKYALAVTLFLLRLLKKEGFVPKKSLLFSAYCDEEFGGSHGALAAALKYPSEILVNLDGRENQIWNCASGGQEAKFFFHYNGAANSAKFVAMGIPVVLEVMEEFKLRRFAELEENPYYKGTVIPKTCLRYMGIKAGNAGMDLNRGEIHFTYYTVKSHDEIYAEFAELEKIMNERLAPLGIVADGFAPHTRFFHYTHIPGDHKAILDLIDAANEATGQTTNVVGSCLSDLSVIGKYGQGAAFAYGCGRDFSLPGGAHQPNEYIECDALVRYAKNVGAYILKILG